MEKVDRQFAADYALDSMAMDMPPSWITALQDHFGWSKSAEHRSWVRNHLNGWCEAPLPF